ncbi:MAG: hypothetical protein JNK85_18560 [Verrucomicrobiales bacterium]|nr:hypothetical protein [Verrucomicrobiales bacterium]
MNRVLPNLDRVAVDQSTAQRLAAHPELRVANLAELWWLRQRFFAEIDRANGLSGSCLGLRWDSRARCPIPDAPAVIVVVPKGPQRTWVERKRAIGGTGAMLYAAQSPFGRPLWCWVEVVPGKDEGEMACDDRQPTELGPENLRLQQRLRRLPLRPGSAIHRAGGSIGALGPILTFSGQVYAATARHVVEARNAPGQPILQGRRTIGEVAMICEEESPQAYLGGRLADLKKGLPLSARRRKATYVLDVAWIRLDAAVRRVGWPDEQGAPQDAVEPYELDPWRPGFGPLGERVISSGPMRGAQAGEIVGFNLQQRDDNSGGSWFADYVIRPLGGTGENADEEHGPLFSEDGDSGKGIWLERGVRPIGILHDALNTEARIGRGPEFWSVASDLGRAWRRLREAFPGGR